jgi:hypothetical protein
MAITLKRQLDEIDKAEILQRFGRKCYATGHAIPEGEPIHFDHISPWVREGYTELNNIAPMCAEHNWEKGTLSLEEFRIKLRMEDFFKRETN